MDYHLLAHTRRHRCFCSDGEFVDMKGRLPSTFRWMPATHLAPRYLQWVNVTDWEVNSMPLVEIETQCRAVWQPHLLGYK
jgi:hypothetical protein